MSKLVSKPIAGQSNIFTKALIFHDSKSASKMVVWDKTQPVYVYFQDGATASRKWSAADKKGFMEAVNTWHAVSGLTFKVTTNKAIADFIESKVGNKETGAATIGEHGNPNDAKYGAHDGALLVGSGGQSYGYYNVQNDGWSAGVKKGSLAFTTVAHEIGHALGLAHPHDTFERSGLFPGVKNGQERVLGTQKLNHTLFAIMSYNGGFSFDKSGVIKLNNLDEPVIGGHAGVASAGPFDIAAIQLLYGVRKAHTGNNTYTLGDKDGPWTTIWDNGGIDKIVYAGSKSAHIDLRPASLKVETIGGGGLNYVSKVHNGYTIAANVWIEKAFGGSGNDVIQGNIKSNTLYGNKGADTILGDGGNDTVSGGLGVDHLYGEAGNDTLTSGGGADFMYGGAGNDILKNSTGVIFKSTLPSNSGYMYGEAGNDTLYNNDARFTVSGGTGVDTLVTTVDSYVNKDIEKVVATGSNSIFIDVLGRSEAANITGNAGNNVIRGGFGSDILLGGAGNDTLDGSRGSDHLNGGDGNDTLTAQGFVGDLDVDYYQASKGTDTITDFALQVDHLTGISGGTVSKDGNNHVVITHGIGTFVLSSVTWTVGDFDFDFTNDDIRLSDENFNTTDILLLDTSVVDLSYFL